jgi:general secretion pathway protein G
MSALQQLEEVRRSDTTVRSDTFPDATQCRRHQGFTVIELLVAVAIIGTIASIVVPAFLGRIHEAKTKRVVMDIKDLELSINQFEHFEGRWPTDLTELETGPYVDRWGHPCEYLSSDSRDWNGKARKDRFLVPLNSDYDLYSVGRDGESRPPLNAQWSQDDVVRANDGLYVGPASEF